MNKCALAFLFAKAKGRSVCEEIEWFVLVVCQTLRPYYNPHDG